MFINIFSFYLKGYLFFKIIVNVDFHHIVTCSIYLHSVESYQVKTELPFFEALSIRAFS